MGYRDVAMRKFRTEDAAAVADIIKKNLLNVYIRDYSEDAMQQAAERFTPKYVLTLSNKSKMYVALDEKKVIGTASIDFDTIHKVFVDEQYHGKGVDKELIALLEEIAENNGIKQVKLIAAPTVQKRYEKLGYDTLEEVDSEELGKEILMEKYLV